MLRRFCLAVAGFAIVGCGEPAVDVPKVTIVPAKGMVTVDGKPASGAHVTLHPVADVGLGAVTPSGVGSPDGSFELTTYAPADGAPAGKYHVTVSWADQISGGSDPEYGKEKLPARYQQPTLSGLTCEISPDDANSLVFALKSR